MESSLTSKGFIKSFDNTEIYYEKKSSTDNKAIVIIIHGLGEHLGRYEYVSNKLIERGYGVYRFDNRGHGRSKGERGHLEDFNHFILDADTVVNLVREEYPDKPIFMLGHSMGGFITASYGIKYPDKLVGQVLSGAATAIAPQVKGVKGITFNLLNGFLPRKEIKSNLSQLISKNEEVVEDYLNDPLVLKHATLRFYVEFLIKGVSWLQKNTSRYSYPCLILHGGDDKIVAPEASKEFYHNINSADKTIKIYDGLYHEIFKEDQQDEVIADMIKWIDYRVKL